MASASLAPSCGVRRPLYCQEMIILLGIQESKTDLTPAGVSYGSFIALL